MLDKSQDATPKHTYHWFMGLGEDSYKFKKNIFGNLFLVVQREEAHPADPPSFSGSK